LKLDFDPRKNMSAFAYLYSKIDNVNILPRIIKIVKSWHNVKILKNYVEIKYKGRTIKFYYDTVKQLINTVWVITETFIELKHDKLNVIDTAVVDVGANIGDTAIFFALKGAKHVYAFEPYPYVYNIAKKNIKLNHLEDKITLLNEGCGKSGFVRIRKDYKSRGGTELRSFKNGKKIRIESLDEIVKRFKLKHAALKVDCEGCEYALLLNASDEALSAFDQVIIEYHYGYKNLVKRLSNIFSVRFIPPKEKGGAGLIYAEK